MTNILIIHSIVVKTSFLAIEKFNVSWFLMIEKFDGSFFTRAFLIERDCVYEMFSNPVYKVLIYVKKLININLKTFNFEIMITTSSTIFKL